MRSTGIQEVVYGAFVLGVYTGPIIGWRADRSMRAGQVLNVLEQALWSSKDTEVFIHHSDQDRQYLSIH